MAENTKTTPSQRALDHASQLAGFRDWEDFKALHAKGHLTAYQSIVAHAHTLDQLWARCPDLAPKTKGALFADEMERRWEKEPGAFTNIAAQMIDENWEPKP